jgi:hypothetical protein
VASEAVESVRALAASDNLTSAVFDRNTVCATQVLVSTGLQNAIVSLVSPKDFPECLA